VSTPRLEEISTCRPKQGKPFSEDEEEGQKNPSSKFWPKQTVGILGTNKTPDGEQCQNRLVEMIHVNSTRTRNKAYAFAIIFVFVFFFL